jgi:hypothetical protein
VATGNGVLEILQLQVDGRDESDGAAFAAVADAGQGVSDFGAADAMGE